MSLGYVYLSSGLTCFNLHRFAWTFSPSWTRTWREPRHWWCYILHPSSPSYKAQLLVLFFLPSVLHPHKFNTAAITVKLFPTIMKRSGAGCTFSLERAYLCARFVSVFGNVKLFILVIKDSKLSLFLYTHGSRVVSIILDKVIIGI